MGEVLMKKHTSIKRGIKKSFDELLIGDIIQEDESIGVVESFGKTCVHQHRYAQIKMVFANFEYGYFSGIKTKVIKVLCHNAPTVMSVIGRIKVKR